MKVSVIIGLTIVTMLWLGLIWIMVSASGFTLKNMLLIIMSGIIIFVPLWKKYIRK